MAGIGTDGVAWKMKHEKRQSKRPHTLDPSNSPKKPRSGHRNKKSTKKQSGRPAFSKRASGKKSKISAERRKRRRNPAEDEDLAVTPFKRGAVDNGYSEESGVTNFAGNVSHSQIGRGATSSGATPKREKICTLTTEITRTDGTKIKKTLKGVFSDEFVENYMRE